MKKRDRIIYWIATVWLSLGMVSSGIVQLIGTKEESVMMMRLGYPAYFMILLGAWKMLGVIAVLSPKFPVLKEWAYAGFFFTATGAIISHAAISDKATEFIGPVLLLFLIVISWYFRPEGRKLIPVRQE